MAPGWSNMLKPYCTVLLLIFICASSLIRAQNHSADGLPAFCSPNVTTVVQQLPGWKHRGCYQDGIDSRLLYLETNGPPNMTVPICASECSSLGYAVFGVESGFHCWCDNILDPSAVLKDQSNCNFACCGDSSVACGGHWLLSVYDRTVTNGSGTNSNNATNQGNDNSQKSNNIALGTGIGIGVPGVILSAVLVIMKFSKRRHNPEQDAFQQSSETSSSRSLYTEPASPV